MKKIIIISMIVMTATTAIIAYGQSGRRMSSSSLSNYGIEQSEQPNQKEGKMVKVGNDIVCPSCKHKLKVIVIAD